MISIEPTNRTSKSKLKYFSSYLIIYTIGLHLTIIIPILVVVVLIVIILCIVIPIICYVKRRRDKQTKTFNRGGWSYYFNNMLYYTLYFQ